MTQGVPLGQVKPLLNPKLLSFPKKYLDSQSIRSHQLSQDRFSGETNILRQGELTHSNICGSGAHPHVRIGAEQTLTPQVNRRVERPHATTKDLFDKARDTSPHVRSSESKDTLGANEK